MIISGARSTSPVCLSFSCTRRQHPRLTSAQYVRRPNSNVMKFKYDKLNWSSTHTLNIRDLMMLVPWHLFVYPYTVVQKIYHLNRKIYNTHMEQIDYRSVKDACLHQMSRTHLLSSEYDFPHIYYQFQACSSVLVEAALYGTWLNVSLLQKIESANMTQDPGPAYCRYIRLYK